MSLRLRALRPADLGAFEALLGGTGFGGCFCAVWCHHGPDWGARCADPARPNLAATAADVRAGRRAGFLVELAGAVVAWTGAGPWSEFPGLDRRLGARLVPPEERAWVLGCLALAPAVRGRGLGEDIVRAVLDAARGAGAAHVDAFPTRPWDEPRSYRGALSTYGRLGFEERGAEADGEAEIVWVRRVLGAGERAPEAS